MIKLFIITMFTITSLQAVEVKDNQVCFEKVEEVMARQLVLNGEACADIANTWQSLAEVNEGLYKNETELNTTYQDQIKVVNNQLESEKTKNKWNKVLYFIGGLVVGGLAGFTYSQVRK